MLIVSPELLNEAHTEGMKAATASAVHLITEHLNTKLLPIVEEIRMGANVSKVISIPVESSVTHCSSLHQEAVQETVRQLRAAGYDACAALDAWENDEIRFMF